MDGIKAIQSGNVIKQGARDNDIQKVDFESF